MDADKKKLADTGGSQGAPASAQEERQFRSPLVRAIEGVGRTLFGSFDRAMVTIFLAVCVYLFVVPHGGKVDIMDGGAIQTRAEYEEAQKRNEAEAKRRAAIARSQNMPWRPELLSGGSASPPIPPAP